MGNSASQTNSDDDDSVTFDCDAESNKEGHLPATSIDLSLLFQHDSLREITTKLKPATPNNVLQQNCKELMQWLESRLDVNEKVVTASQFCELLGGRGASREDCMQAYSAFDSEGTGEAEIEAVMEALRSSGGYSSYSSYLSLRIRNNVLLKQLVITVATSDQSYMPQLVSVSVGKTPDKLKEIKEVRVPSNVTGDVTLLENTKSVFPFVQINIKRCHSDGCDTRVRGIKTLGQRVHYSPGLSVTDATAIWYLQVIASTATAYIPVAPQLRQTILEHSKQALTHIAPLSLTHSSAERPAFLTPIVLGEISRFLESLALDPSGTSVIDGLHVMLWFSLARGHLASIISTLQCILKHPEMKMACIPLITSLDSIYTSTLQRHAVVLHPALAGTSGGKRDIFSSPSNLLSSSPGAGYVTAAGVTKVNVHFKSDDYLELTRLNIKVHRGAIGARSGLVFVYTAEGNDNVCSSKYSWDCCDSWTEKDFAEFKANQGTKVTRKGPVAFFHLDDDWDEVEVKLADVSSGKNIMIKFLQPRGPASMIGIMSIHFFGYKRKHVTFIGDICATDTEAITDTVERNGPLGEADSAYGSHHVQTSSSEVVLEETGTRHSSLAHVETEDDNTLVSCETLVARMLQFVSGLAVRQAESLSSSLARHMTLDLSDFTIDAFWQLYSLLLEAGDSTVWACCRVLCLQLFLALLPNISEASVQKSCKISTLFQHLCDVVDGRGSHCQDEICASSYYQDSMKAIAQEIISSGATIFYPDDEARRKQLFSMIDTISADNVSESASMVFQSLCQFFGNVNPQAILFLPVNLPDDFSIEPTLGVLSKLLTVAKTEYMTLLTEKQCSCLCMLQQSSEKRKFEMCQNLLVRWTAAVTGARRHDVDMLLAVAVDDTQEEKFTVTARGYPDMPSAGCTTCSCSAPKLLGSYTGLWIQMMVADSTPDDVAGHELWPTLFRGGRVVRKLTRSFSGMHESCTDESAAYSLLRDLLEEKKESRGQALLEQCRKSRRTRAGGAHVDAAIAAVFAALIWHTQQLREEVEQVAESEAPVSANDGVLHAYAAAESVRSYLLEQRQRQRQQADDSAGDPAGVDPVRACHEKAEMLLGFAGLLRRDAASCGRLLRSGGKPQRVPPPSDRATSPADETPALDARQASFCLVLSFVRDCALASDKVERLLAERRRRAAAVADALDVTFKFLSLGEDILHLPNVLFLQELLTHLDKTVSRMPWHYADKINGCGLQLEARVRGGYYALVGQLVNAVKAFDRRSARTKLVPIYDFMLACTLHLLDIPWQPYDFAFLQSIEFPRLLMDIASSGITIHGIVTDEDGDEKELAEYEQYMQWLPECRENVNRWYKKMLKQAQKKQDVQMFIARFSDLLNVEIECDGCGATLTGRRYRCLQCAELDLCCTCFIVAVKPSDDAGSDGEATAHADDHDFVNLMFKCNCCEAFIVGTRMHCRECDDYDLCVGCHRTARAYPGAHARAHAVDRHPLVKLRNSPLSESVMQTYAHQHVWLLLSSFALSLTALLSREDPGLDPAYLRSATALQADCFTLATTALQQVVTLDGDAVAGRHQVAFSPLSQEKIVGLLGAMILSCGEHRRLLDAVRSNELLVLLFRIAQRQTLHDCNTAHMALTILGRLLQLIDVDTCSKAVRAAQSLAANDASAPQDERVDVVHAPQLNEVGMDDFETQPGASVVQFLFQFGTQCLDRGLQDWTSSVVMILQSMSSTEVWRDGVLRHVSECIYQMKYAITSEEILCLLVAAGFPDLLSTGVKVLYNEAGSEGEVGFIVKHFVDAGKCLLVNQQTRKRSTVKNQYINRVHEPVSIINQQHLRGLLDVITTLIAKADGREKMSSAALWALALCFKSLYHMCKNSGEERTPLLALCNEQLIRVMMRQASLGTGFNKQCMVQELEVLSLMLYTADESKLIDSDAVIPEPKTKVRKKSHEAAAAASGSSVQAAPSTNVRRDASVCFGVLHEHIVQSTLTHSDLKNNTTHENSGGQHAADALLLEMYKNLFDTKLRSTRASANSLASLDEQPLASGSDSDSDGGGVDTGVIRFALRMPSPGPVETEATRETQEGDSCLMRVEDSELEDKLVQKHRVRSSQMLRQELEACRTGTSRRYLYRLNLTLSVFHARHLLAEVLAAWPLDSASLVITGELLGCTNDSQIACVLDLLHRWDNSKDFQQLVTHVVKHCGTSCANAIAQAACYFMEESSFDSCTKESDHSYTEARATSGKVHIPNASFLLVKFDRRCHTRAKWDELSLALDGNFEQELHVYSGTSSDDQWQNFHLPGDTLYYKFCKRLDVRNSEQSVKPEFWGWRFTVTGGRMGRFDTGYMIMNSLLCHEPTLNTLPMERIWSYLVHVACKQTGQQRLKTIELLLRVLNSMGSPGDSSQKAVHDDRKCTSDTADDVFTKEQFASNTAEKLHAGTQHTSGEADNHSGALQSGRVDLTLLRPLWLLYGSLQEKQLDTGSAVIPQLNRALTELFYVAEERAGAWSVVDAYLLATHDYAALRDVVAEVAVDIAAIGAAIECTNAATNLCRHCLAA
ncbi:PREDICTED: zinc finger ZZ-type and EF-hand domain-containing protein 1-like [Priapulus caudatus]|uniref:Zinc finger ZZ-type and EF-hand domain-containing protein 1-like n=1 Tax=Priapulus caudatus TaxID=37621 RepID=A0ABM1DT07_PRICU|nr:PREDICTED: zinc finger ZZ-type and EF-hand domain-containing protein 1-like [Priapulus caudatus]